MICERRGGRGGEGGLPYLESVLPSKIFLVVVPSHSKPLVFILEGEGGGANQWFGPFRRETASNHPNSSTLKPFFTKKSNNNSKTETFSNLKLSRTGTLWHAVVIYRLTGYSNVILYMSFSLLLL